jgi:hypothetical protein
MKPQDDDKLTLVRVLGGVWVCAGMIAGYLLLCMLTTN